MGGGGEPRSLSAAAFAAVREALEPTTHAPDEHFFLDEAAAASLGSPEDVALLLLSAEQGTERRARVGAAAYGAVRRSFSGRVGDVKRLRARLARDRAAGAQSRELRAASTRDGLIAQGACEGATRSALADARLVRQLEAAERRLQELAHECLGEHEKARWRIEARGARTAARRRAERDAPGDFGNPRGPGQRPAAPPRLSLRDVAPHGRSRDDFARSCAAKDAVTRGAARGAAGGMLRAALRGAPSTDDDVAAALDGLSVTRCVRARGAAAAAARPAAAAYAFSGFPHAATPAALVDLLSAGARTRAVAERRRRGDGAPVRCVRCDAAPRPPHLSPTVLLNANAALWFLAGNPGAAFEDADDADADADPCAFALAGARVYYCLDERTMLPDDWNARAPPPAPEGNGPAEALVADGPGLRVAQDLAAAVAAAYLDGPLTEGAVSDPTLAAPRPAARYRGDHRRNATERARKALGRGAQSGEAAPTTAREAVDALADALASHPAVVETADGLHFGAASVAHLLEARRGSRGGARPSAARARRRRPRPRP